MSRNMSIREVDDQVYLKFRLLCLGNGLNMAGMLKKMVDYQYENEKNIPGKSQQRRMKKFVKKLALRGESNE